MAIYKINNDVYDIPEEVVSDFERDNPDAVISYRVGKDEYEIPLHEKGGFLKHFPDAVSLIEEPVDTSMDLVTPKPRVDVTGPVSAQPEYKNPLTNTPEYNLESIRQSGAIEMVKGERDDKGRLRDAVAEKRASVVPELGQAIEDVEESKRKYRKEHPVLSALSGFRGSMAPSVEGIHINDPKFRNLSAASQLLNESEKLLARRNGGSGVIEGTKSVIEGAKEAASNLNTYSMGLTEMLDNSSVLSVITKFEKGEELSPDEQHLLDAVAINMSAQAVAGDPDLGHLAGSAFVESIPFMVEMMMNPISGAGEGLGKAMTKYALKRFGKKAGSKALEKGAKIAGRVAGDAMAATGMSATSGIVGVAADATARMTGTPVYTDDFGEIAFGDVARDEKGEVILDGNGKPVPVGSVDKESEGKALYKAFADRSIQNFSEMFGEYFGMAGKTLMNTKLGKKVSSSALMRAMNEFTTADWTKQFNQILKDGKYNGFIGETAEEYVGGLLNTAFVGDQSFEDLASTDNLVQTVAAVGLMSGIFGSVNLAGIRLTRYKARKDLEKSEKEAYNLLGEDFDVLRDNISPLDPDAQNDAIRNVLASPDLDRDQKEAVFNYFHKQSYYDGLKFGENKRIEEAVQAETEAVRAESNPGTGMYIEASKIDPLSGERIPGTIVQGTMEDDKDRVTWKGSDGKVEMILKTEIDPSTVRSESIQEVIDASIEAVKKAEQEQISRDSKYNPEILSPEETLGQVFYVDGNPHIFKYENGKLRAYLVDINGQPIKPVNNVSVDDYYVAKQEEIDYEESSKNAPLYKLPDGRIVRLIARDEEEVAVEILDRDGVAIDNFSMPTEKFDEEASAIESQKQSPHADNDLTNEAEPPQTATDDYSRFVDTGEVSEERVNDIASKIIRGEPLNPEEESMRAGAAQRVEDKLKEASNPTNTSQITTENAIASPNEESNVSQNPSASEVLPADEPEQSTPAAIPADENGNLLYHQAPVEATLSDILDGSLDSDEIDAFVGENKKAAGTLLKKVSEKPPKMSTNKTKYLAQKKAWSDRVAEAEQQVAYWNEVESILKESHMKPGDKAAEEIKSMGEPLTGEELAAVMLANGSIKLTKESYKKETGAGEEETKKMFGLFATPQNGGVSIERAGELVMLADLENGTNHFDQEDPNAGRNAIIEVLSSARTRGDLIDYVKNNREAMAERERQAEYNAYAEWCEEVFHMSPEEYDAYEEQVMKDIVSRHLDDASYNELMSIFATEQNINEDEKSNAEQSGTGEVREGSREILPGEESVPTERVGRTEEGSGAVDGSLDNENGVAYESPSGRNVSPYFISNVDSGNGGNFYRNSEGNIDLAIIPKEVFDKIGIEPAPFRITESMANHVLKQHGKEINAVTKEEAVAFVIDIMNNFDHVRQGNNVFSYIFSVENDRKIGKRAITIIIPSNVGEYLGVLSSGFERKDRLEKRPLLWEKGANETSAVGSAPTNVTPETAHQGGELNGSASNQRNDLSIVKDRGLYGNDQTKKGEKKYTPSRETLITPSSNPNRADGVTLPSNGDISIDKDNISSPDNQTKEEKAFVSPERREGESLLDYAERVTEAHKLFEEKPQTDLSLKENTNVGSEMLQKVPYTSIKPIGIGPFGPIYDQFRGKVKEAFDFLLNRREGDLLGVFHRDDVGDIDLVWGDAQKNQGIAHILDKHVERQSDFQSVEEAINVIEDVIINGVIQKEGKNRIELIGGNYKVVIRKDFDGVSKNWIVTAFDYERGITEKTSSTITRSTPDSNEGGRAVASDEVYGIKDSDISSENQTEKAKPFVSPEKKEGENLLDYAERITEVHKLFEEEQKVETNPSEAQKEAGNYKKGHIKIDGFDITIEQPAGSVRSGKDADGKEWSVVMNNTYGYIRGTKGVDGDHIDVFLGPNTDSEMVYVVDQVNPDGSFDEHKVMMGFNSLEDAKNAYLSNYEEGWQGLGDITGIPLTGFKEWVDSSHRKTKPFAEYKQIKKKEEFDESIQPLGEKSQTTTTTKNSDQIRFREVKPNSEEEIIIKQAKTNGTYMKAPNGKPSNLDERQWVQVRTKAFKDWFGDWETSPEEASKVVDENGEPKVVLHGTPHKFNTFDRGRQGSSNDYGWLGSGFYFYGNNRRYAELYAKGGDIKEVFLSVRSPYYATSSEMEVLAEADNRETSESFTEDVLSENCDGVSYDGDLNDEWVVYDPNQIKSATENIGEFSLYNDDIRFREVKEKDGSKSLVGLHNISENKLKKALKLGGFANPSAAVIDVSKQTHEGYGEISLVLPSSMIDKKTGRNAGTWSQDAWTPVYPQIEKQFGEKGGDKASEDIMSVPKEMQGVTRQGVNSWMDGRSGKQLAYLYLHEQGKAPDLIRVEAKYPESLHKEVKNIMGDGIGLYDLDTGKQIRLLDLYIRESFSGDKTAYEKDQQEKIQRIEEKIKLRNNPKSLVVRRAQEDLDDLKEKGYDYNQLADFAENVLSDAKYTGTVNDAGTLLKAQEYIAENGLQKDFDRWLDSLNDRYEVKEVIFDGFTSSGYRRYTPNTLENVSKFMKKEGRNAATGLSASFNTFAAGMLKMHGSLNDIRREKGKLTSDHSDVDAFREKWSDVYYDLGMKLQPDAKGFDDYGLARLMEAAQSKTPKKYIKDEYGIDFSDEDASRLNEMIEAIRNEYPATYFETKFERPVYLEEFAAAVVPDNVDKEITEAMANAGMQVFTYKNGDEASRNEAVQKATEIEGVRFRKPEDAANSGIDEVNQKFNEELQQQIDGTLSKGHVYHLGRPDSALLSAGIPNLPIELAASRLSNKSMQENHPFELGEIENLPQAIHNPMAVFRSATHIGSFVVMTEIEHKGRNFVVAIQTNKTKGKIEINDIRSIHYRTSNAHMANWIEEGLLEYVDKKRMPEWLSKQRYNSAEVKKLYGHATKIIENFQNPTPKQGEIVSEINDLSSKLHTPVTIITDVNEITDANEKNQLRKRSSKGWYDPQTKEIVIVLPNNRDVADVQRTFLHEAVAHHGLRKLFGDDFDTFLNNVYTNAEGIRREILRRTQGNPLKLHEATEEYLADLAERGFDNKEERSLWSKIKDAFIEMLRKVGVDLGFKLSDADLRYILWRSYRNLEEGNLLDLAEDVSMRNKWGIGDYGVHNDNIAPDVVYRDNDPLPTGKRKQSRKKKGSLAKDKKMIENLRERIDRMGKNSEQIEDAKKDLVNEIKNRIDSKDASRLNKEDLMSLLRQVRDIKTKEDLSGKLMEVERISYEIGIRSAQRDIDKSLALKTQDVNGKNMSIAKNVDDSTRRIFQFMRGRLSDLKASGYEQDMTDLRRRNKELRELIDANKRKSLYGDLSENESLSVANEIASYEQEIETNKAKLSDLKAMAEDIRNAKAKSTESDLDEMIDELKAKMSAAASGSAIWKREDSERLTALNIIKNSLESRKYDRAAENTLVEIEAKLRNNSQLYRNMSGKGVVDKGDAKERRSRAKEIIAENKRQIVCFRRLYNEIRRSQLDVLKSTQEQLTELINGGKDALRKMTEEEIERGRSIIRNSLDDVIDKPVDINNMKAGEMNFLKKFFSAPLGSFDYMAQRIGRKFFNGEGYIYQYFVKGENGTIACENTYAKGIRRFRDTFEAKTKEIFGKNAESILYESDKKIKNTGIYMIDTHPGDTYGQKVEKELTRGEAMYLYMVWKMNDGRMKLEKQGVDDDTMREIEDFIGPQYRKLADWIQEDLLVNLRDKYNERYLEMYDTQMANIPNYVPLRINKNAVSQESNLEDNKRREKSLEERTRSLIKRTVNDKPVDLTTNGIGVVFEHVKEMEEWYAFVRVRRDLDYVLGNIEFRNRVNANAHGHFSNFKDAAILASHSHLPNDPGISDTFWSKLSKGVVGGNIAFRLNTAAKQIYSLPAFLGYSQSPKFMACFAKNIGLGLAESTSLGKMKGTYQWCIENMPLFYARVKEGDAGNEKLQNKGFGKGIDKYLKSGMVPNKFVDAFTVAIGAKTVYEYTYDRLTNGPDKIAADEARRQALVDADIFFNQSQQSGMDTFLSPMQRSRSMLDIAFTTYQNSNIGYVRKVMLNFYDLVKLKDWNKLRGNYVEKYISEGIEKNKAYDMATGKLLNDSRKQLFGLMLFGWGMNMLWDWGSRGLMGFFAGDDDENDMYKDIVKYLTSPIRGIPIGNIVSNLVEGYDINPVIFMDEVVHAWKSITTSYDDNGIDPLLAIDVLSSGSKLSGFDLEMWGNIYLGMEGAVRHLGREGYEMQDLLFFLNTPKSQRVKVAHEMYKDSSLLDFAEKVSRAYRYTPLSDKWEYWVPGTERMTHSKMNKIKKEYQEEKMTDEQKEKLKESKELEKKWRKIKDLSIDPGATRRYLDNH